MERDVKKMSICGHFEKWYREECYMTWIFGSFLVTLCALTDCHAVMKQG